MRKENCIFCKIVNGEIPSATLYEDDLFQVIFDISPANPGHALILPKNHYDNLFDLGEEESRHLLETAKKVAVALKEEFAYEGLNLLQNNGELAGQTEFHFHLHLIPRYPKDNQKVKIKYEPLESDADELQKHAKSIAARLQ